MTKTTIEDAHATPSDGIRGPMPDHSKTFEVTIAAIGLVVTALLGYGQLQLASEQAAMADRQRLADAKRDADTIEVQVMNLVAPHLVNLAKPGQDFLPSYKVVLAASEYLSGEHKRPALAAMSAKLSEGNASVPRDVGTRLQEASQDATSSTQWFAVVATLAPDSEPAAQRWANQYLERARTNDSNASVRLYKTKISNNYAVVYGAPGSRAQASDLARRARELKLAPDAFAQQDRQWKEVGVAPFKL